MLGFMAEFPKCQTKLKFQSMSYIHVFKISMTMSRKIKTGGSNEKKKIKVTKKKTREFISCILNLH